jgi:hypothetical protein
MAERGVPTNKLFVAKALAMQAGTGFDRPLYMALDKADMSGLDATSNALGSEATESGVARAAATLSIVTTGGGVTDDTCRVYKSFSVGATVTIYGAGAFNASSTGNMMAFHEWPALVNLINGDTVNETIDLQDKAG